MSERRQHNNLKAISRGKYGNVLDSFASKVEKISWEVSTVILNADTI
jgi:hypothetical protein